MKKLGAARMVQDHFEGAQLTDKLAARALIRSKKGSGFLISIILYH